jgi:deoxyribonuclease V
MNLKRLEQEQKDLAKKITLKDEFKKIKTIAGVDQSYTSNKIISAIILMNYETLEVIEKNYSIQEEKFPYIPGFLAYRDSPAIIEAYNNLKTKPDILILDGHGILHPRGLGLASHISLLLDIPTIGVAKNLLYGKPEKDLILINRRPRGVMLKTKEHAKPIYISPGNKITLSTAVKIIRHCMKEHKLPEPLYLAHKYATKIKNSLKE